MNWQVTLIIVLVTVLYAVIGGIIFHFLEKDYEVQLHSEVLAEFDVLFIGGIIFHFLEKDYEVQLHSEVLAEFDVLCSGGCLNGSDIVSLKSILSEMYIGGLEIAADTHSLTNHTRWDMASSIFVAIQIFSSVGFGRVAPASSKGRVACFIFGLLGIPLFFAAALIAGQLIALLGRKFCRCSCIKQRCRPKIATVLFFTVTAAVGLILLVVIPSAIFSSMEKWSYAEAFYFCMTTLYTLGFSDYLPGYNLCYALVDDRGLSDEFLRWYRLALGFWIVLLIFWYGTFLNLIKKNATRFAEKGQEIAAEKLRHKVEVLAQNRNKRSELKAEDLKTLEDVIRKGQYTTVMTAGLKTTTIVIN